MTDSIRIRRALRVAERGAGAAGPPDRVQVPRRRALQVLGAAAAAPAAGGSSFTSVSEKNPTLTILALAWRAGDCPAEELRSGRW